MKKPRILITNDDGIDAPGIKHLWKALGNFAELFIVAPATQQSGKGLGLTLHEPLLIDEVPWKNGTKAWKVNGTPADCVRLALSVLLDKPPTLIVSGINRGSNAGRNALYSGTVGGVIEGALRGIFGIAFSCEDFLKPNYAITEKYIAQLVKHFLDAPLPSGSLLNVTFPEIQEMKGVRLAHQGQGFWIESPQKRTHPDGDFHYYWHGLKWNEQEEHKDSDVSLLKQGYVTVVPLQISQLTNHEFLREHKPIFDAHFIDS